MAIQKSFYGRLCKDHTIKKYKTKDGKKGALLSNTLAEDVGKDKTFFINFVAFGQTAKLLKEYTHKGTAVLLHGMLENTEFEDKEGNTRYGIQLVVNSIDFSLNNKGNEDEKPKTKKAKEPKEDPEDDADDFDFV